MSLIAAVYAAEVASESVGSGGVAASFGLNIWQFVAQLVNFGLLVFVLHRLLYRPLLIFMHERSERIAAGLTKEQAATEKLQGIEVERGHVIAKAEAEGRGIVLKAQSLAASLQDKAHAEAEALMAETRKRLEREAEQVRQETLVQVREQAAELVVLAAEKVLREKIDAKADQALVEKALKEISL